MTPSPNQPPPNDQTTAVNVVFKRVGSSEQSSNISAQLYDERNSFTINVDCEDNKNFVSGKLMIDLKDDSDTATLKTLTLRPGSNVFDSNKYEFANGSSYALKIELKYKENNVIQTFHSFFSHGTNESNQNTPSYTFLYREDGGDDFHADSGVTNPNDIENGSTIIISAPIVFANNNDSREPHTVSFVFDETDDYTGTANDTDNTEQLVSYSADFAYESNGEYHLENNQLTNGHSYLVTVTGHYSDGEVITKTLDDKVTVLVAPVIDSITAYGLDSSSISGADQTGAGEDSISTVMEVKITAASSPNMIPAVDNEITFNFKQNGTLMYSATINVISVNQAVNGNITYTVLKDDLTQEWAAGNEPVQNEDGSYTYDVTAVVSYSVNEGDDDIVKTSNSVTKNFTSDIIPINQVTISNAWIAASVTTVDGQRVVDLNDVLSANGYNSAPETAIVGQFSKHDYFGSGIESGFHQDLDKIDTKFKFEMCINRGVWQPVQNLHLILGADGASDQQNYVTLMSALMQSDDDGLYSNPVSADFVNVAGSQQPNVYFMVCGPPQNSYQQKDLIKVRVQIVTPNGETTLPSPTESNEQIVVNKVNQYIMELGTASEPKFTGSGDEGVLEIPIDNSTASSNEYYLESVTFQSSLNAPNDSVTETVSEVGNEDGVFDLTVTNPGVNENIDYTVYYTISDPNGNTTIRGPVSEQYTISVADEPTNENFSVTDYNYKTFNDDGESSFEFKVSFQDGDETTIDGINVYFKSDNDDNNSSNNIPETLVATVSRYNIDGSGVRVEHDATDLIEVTLQTTDPSTSAASDGVNVLNIEGINSNNQWNNFRSGTIVFRAYKTPKVSSFDDEKVEASGNDHEEDINNIPIIDPVDPESVSLTGGVIQSYSATQVSWTNDLSDKYGSLSNVVASHDLSVNGQDQTGSINIGSDSYIVDIDGAASTYTVDIKVKITTDNGDVFYSEPTTVVFDSVSVDTSLLDVTVVRGSKDTVLKASYPSLVVDGGNSNDLVVTSVGIVDNQDPENEDPEDEGVDMLPCTSTEDDIQPPSTVNTYNISSYELGDDIDAVVRVEAGVKYTVNGGTSQDSTPLYLTLSAAKNYVVAKKVSVSLPQTYTVNGDGDTLITLNINANGLWVEGLQGCFVMITQDGDYTDADDDDANGAMAMLQFDSTQAVTSYETQEPATTTPSPSTDNMAVGESFQLTDDNGHTYTLTLGTLNSGDESVLTVPASAGFDSNKSLTMVVVASTRLGQGHDIGTVDVD